MDPARSSVYVILLNWNDTSNTLECLESLGALPGPDCRILVIDNASREPCTAAVAECFPEVEVVESPENLGFVGGCNLGMRLALERGADYVWLLNNDTVVDPLALSELVHAAEADAKTGIVGSKILFYNRAMVIDHAGGYVLPRRCIAGHIGIGEKDVGQYDQVRSVDYVSGCSLLARRAIIEDIGLLDDDLFAYWEDVDWCTRARRRGWQVLYIPTSVVRHKGGDPSSISPLRYYLSVRNSLRYIARHHPYALPNAVPRWVYRHIFKPIGKRRFGQLRLGLAALRDLLLRRSGLPS